MGTPHSGSGLADWAAGLATALGLVRQTNTKLLDTLKRDSEVLARINTEFHTMIRARMKEGEMKISIKCFFEELSLRVIGRMVSVSPHIHYLL
jgi:protein SERAC1